MRPKLGGTPAAGQRRSTLRSGPANGTERTPALRIQRFPPMAMMQASPDFPDPPHPPSARWICDERFAPPESSGRQVWTLRRGHPIVP
jgi:hypothetical protein